MAVTAPTPVETRRTCKVCCLTKPLDMFVKSKHGRLHTCQVCRRKQRRAEYERRKAAGDPLTSSTERQKRADLRQRLGHRHVDDAPDPQPARLLVELLRYDRAFGLDFNTAWSEGVAFVLERIRGPRSANEREGWAEAFNATRAAYEAAWRRVEGGPGSGLTPALLDALSGQRAAYERP
jgi:hypothetical protein